MSGLLGSLAAAARALDAQRYGLDVAGQNIANVNTPGYTRREALLASVPGVDRLSPGLGVEISGVRASRDERLESRLRRELPFEGREQALASVLAVVETAIGGPGESVDAALSEFFDSMSRLAGDPTSAIARQEVLARGGALGESFRDMVSRLELARADADAGVRAGVEEVNALVMRIASLNEALGKAPANGSESLHLRDELGVALKSLAGLVDIDTIARPDGGADVSFANGRPLAIGATAYQLEMSSGGPWGATAILSEGADVTGEVDAGSIGGLLHARDAVIPGYLDRLDALAFSVATEVNALHRGGYDLDGNTGANFFVEPGAVAGAAKSLTLDPGVLADGRKIAAAGTTSAGDNTVARALASLRDERVMSGGTATFADSWSQLVYRVGADARMAMDEQRSRAEIVRQVELLREQVSGVSLDEEAMMMMKFQRAYEANARYFQAIDRALDTLIQALGR